MKTTQPGAILIVEDDPNDVFLDKAVLASLALLHPLHAVGNGEEMIAYLEGQGIYRERSAYPYPTLILLDLKMPGMDGFHAIQWLQSHPEHAVPFVILSTKGAWPWTGRAKEFGARNFLQKPIHAGDFLTMAKSLGLPLAYQDTPSALRSE